DPQRAGVTRGTNRPTQPGSPNIDSPSSRPRLSRLVPSRGFFISSSPPSQTSSHAALQTTNRHRPLHSQLIPLRPRNFTPCVAFMADRPALWAVGPSPGRVPLHATALRNRPRGERDPIPPAEQEHLTPGQH